MCYFLYANKQQTVGFSFHVMGFFVVRTEKHVGYSFMAMIVIEYFLSCLLLCRYMPIVEHIPAFCCTEKNM